MSLQRFTVVMAGALACLVGTEVHAAEQRPEREPSSSEAPPESEPPNSEPRERPNYDGRGGPPTTPGDVALWVPRVVLSPAYFVSEFLLRRPLGWAIAGAERAHLPAVLYDFFTFGPDHNAGFFPTAYMDFGFQPSVGLYTFWDNAGFKGHQLRLRGATGGREWLSGGFTERFLFGEGQQKSLTLQASALRRPDYTYFGIGSDTRKGELTRYGADRLEGRVTFEQRIAATGSLRTESRILSTDFRRGGFGGDPLLADAVRDGAYAPGYTRGYTLLESGLTLSFDQRRLPSVPPVGAFAAAQVKNAADVRATTRFVKYGARAGGFVDLNERGRVLSLAVTTLFADPVGGGEIPFPELVTLGGTEPMRGFVEGRLRGRSAAVAELAYRWPIWMWLDGNLRTEVGNVFGERLDGFSAGQCRWSGTVGVESTGGSDSRFELLVGAGSETFDSGGKVDSVRIVVGTTHGL